MRSALLLLVILLAGCDRPRLTPPIGPTLTVAQIDQVFEREEIYGYSLAADRVYSVPMLSWFEREFPVEWQKFSGSIMGRYAAEARDCDDFARAAAFVAQLLHSRWLGQASGLAVGEFWYESAQGNHALVAAICLQDGTTNLVVAFFEPQFPGRVVGLTPREYRSCWARRF